MTENSEERDEARAWVSPSLAPIGFAAGLILVLIGLLTDYIVFGVGIGIAIIAGFMWVYNASRGMREADEPEVDDTAAFELAEPASAGPSCRMTQTPRLPLCRRTRTWRRCRPRS